MMERVAGGDGRRGRGRTARARGRADARPGRRPARKAARRRTAGAPRGAAVLGARWTLSIAAAVEGRPRRAVRSLRARGRRRRCIPASPPPTRRPSGGVDRWQDRRLRRSLAGCARRLLSPAAELRRPRGAHRERGLHGRARLQGVAEWGRRSSSTRSRSSPPLLRRDDVQPGDGVQSEPPPVRAARIRAVGRVPDAVGGEDAIVYWCRL